MSSTADLIYERAKELPEYAAREVLDFVAFLQSRIDKQQDNDLMKAQQKAMNEVWDNADDEVWNNV